MLESLPASDGNLVCFRAVGTLTEEDYAEVFIPVMTDVLTQYPMFRLYVDLSRLLGWDETSSWETGAVLHSNGELEQTASRHGHEILLEGFPAQLAGERRMDENNLSIHASDCRVCQKGRGSIRKRPINSLIPDSRRP